MTPTFGTRPPVVLPAAAEWYAVPSTRRVLAAVVCAAMLAACTPQQALIASLIPTGAVGTMLGNLERVSEDNYRRVVELETRRDWQGLASFADANFAKDRFNPDWMLIAGYARTQQGEHREAAKAYAEAARLEPDNATAWHLLAQSYRASGEADRAVNVLNNALLALRNPALTYYLLGESYGDLGRHAEAAAAYREAVKIEQRFPAAWLSLAKTYHRLGRTTEAREAELQLEKIDPKLARRLREPF